MPAKRNAKAGSKQKASAAAEDEKASNKRVKSDDGSAAVANGHASTATAAAPAASAAPAVATASASASSASGSGEGANRPKDWPIADSRVPIDLKVQDLPHKSSDTEWWYVNGHVKITKKAPARKGGKKAAPLFTAPMHPSNGPTNLGHGEAPVKATAAQTSMEGRELSFFASFFRLTRSRDPVTAVPKKVHSLTWGLVDPTAQVYYADPVLDPSTPEIVAESLRKGSYAVDGRLRKAFMEVCEKGNVPLPDRMMAKPANVSETALDLDYCGQTFTKDEKGNYHCHCENSDRQIALTLQFVPKKQAVRQGHDGVVKIGLKAETMFYYFIPRLAVTGTVVIDGVEWEVAGNGWYDHEFGSADGTDKSIPNANASQTVSLPMNVGGSDSTGPASSPTSSKDHKIVIQPRNKEQYKTQEADEKEKEKPKREKQYAWNWMSVQLENGFDVTATNLVDPDANEVLDNFAITIGPNSERIEYDSMTLKPLNNWQSVRTTFDYPTKWELNVPGADLKLVAEAPFEDQEFITLIARPAFWEGRLHITGTFKGQAVKGVGFIERHGFEGMSSLDNFFKKISKSVLGQIEVLLPVKPNHDQVKVLMANDEFGHLMEGANIDVFHKTITLPLRQIIDRGGKSWRSFSMLLCLDCVGGYSPRYKHWLAMPEIMHVGSLIVDDIQDKSDTRRGGPACHLVHGDAIAINAGTAAYFLSLHLMQKLTPWMTQKQKLDMYELFFLTLRGGHAGQAFDIYGLDYMMDQVAEKGNGAELEQRVKCTHRLKSAVPAGNLARMGAIAGGGKHEQVEALGQYLESIGVAFQIIDDVLNLRGFKGNTKNRGEDITAGKITYPVAKAMSRMKSAADRKRIWGIIKSKPTDQKTVEAVCDELEKIGAIEACVDESAEMVEDAWGKLDKMIPDSFYKMILRSFGWYVLQRHY